MDPAPRTDSNETYPPFSSWIVLASMTRFTLSVLCRFARRIRFVQADDGSGDVGNVVDSDSVDMANNCEGKEDDDGNDDGGRGIDGCSSTAVISFSNQDRALDSNCDICETMVSSSRDKGAASELKCVGGNGADIDPKPWQESHRWSHNNVHSHGVMIMRPEENFIDIGGWSAGAPNAMM